MVTAEPYTNENSLKAALVLGEGEQAACCTTTLEEYQEKVKAVWQSASSLCFRHL